MYNIGDLSGKQIDQYRLVRQLGNGGCGIVYLAEHILHKTLVAIKILFTHLNTENIPGFIAEANSALLDHPHIMRVRKFGVDNGSPFFIMNYTPHGNLRQRHPSRTPLSWEIVVLYVRQIADAL